MPTVTVTPAMAQLIKDERKARKIRGDTLSRNLGKTNTFISQIETGKIKEIDSSLFYKIFKEIIDEDNFDSYMNKLTSNTDVFIQKYSVDEINEEKAFLIFEQRFCRIPITDCFISYLEDQLNVLQISGSQLVQEINKNKFLDNPEQYNDNEYLIDVLPDGNGFNTAIKFNLKETLIDDIIVRKEKTICYIFSLGIVYNIQLLLNVNEYDAKSIARKILDDCGILLPHIRNNINYLKTMSENSNKFSWTEDKYIDEYNQHIEDILSMYNIAKDVNILDFNNSLERHLINLKDNMPFAISMLASPLSEIPQEKKVDFFNEYKQLIKNYTSIDD